MSTKATIITYQYPISVDGIGCSATPNASPSYPDYDLAKSTFTWEIANQSVVTNKTTFNWSLTVQSYSNILTSAEDYLYVDEILIQDVTADSYNKVTLHYDKDAKSVEIGKTVKVASGSFTMSHKTNGKLSFPMYIRAAMHVGAFHSSYAIETTNTVTPTDISRHAMIYTYDGFGRFTDEDSPVIKYAVPSGLTGYIYLSLDGKATSEDTTPRAVTGEGNYTYEFTQAEREKLLTIQNPDGVTEKQVKFYIKSVANIDGQTYRESLSAILNIINYMPTLQPRVWDSNEDVVTRLTGNSNKLVRYVSNASFETGGEAHKGATIGTQTTINAGIPLDGPSGVFEKVASPKFNFFIYDNYGRLTTNEKSFIVPSEFVEYVKLTCSSSATVMTVNGDTEVTLTGMYFNGDFGNKVNRLRMSFDLYKNNEQFDHNDWGYIDNNNKGTWTYDSSTYIYSYTFTLTGLEYLSIYEIVIKVSDEVAVDGVEARSILVSTPVFDWSSTDFNFNVPVTIQEWQVDTVVDESTNEAGSYYDSEGLPQIGDYHWSFRKWSSGLLECWCSVNVTTDVSGALGGLYTSGRLDKTNLIFPRSFIDKPVVVASLAPNNAGGILMAAGSGSTTVNNQSTGPFEIARGSSYSGATYTINYMVKGRWK